LSASAGSAICRVPQVPWRGASPSRLSHGAESVRLVPEETAVAFTYNRSAHAVMMATPADLEDFAVGFTLNEGIVGSPRDIEEIDVVRGKLGIELRMWIGHANGIAFYERRRFLAGPTGCGLCGIESLADAMRPVPPVTGDVRVSAMTIQRAIAGLPAAQRLYRETRAVHGAAYWEPGAGLVALREDVGRHNALDKLAGALARAGFSAKNGVVLLTSRISVEMVQKAARMGAPIVAAVSAPTALAVRLADAAGITLIGVARDDGFETFTHPQRVTEDHV